MAYQFTSIETYSERAKSVKDAKDHYNSAAQVPGEAGPEPQYSTHVGGLYRLSNISGP